MNQANVAILLFEDFETLDVFGPVEIFGRLADLYSIGFYSLNGGIVTNKHHVAIQTESIQKLRHALEILLIPGGLGTRVEVHNTELLNAITQVSMQSNYVLTVCTGSALLAKTGLLDNKSATTNKKAFTWVASLEDKVNWVKNDRWTVDGKYYTSAGVSAGTDMALGFISDVHGKEFAKKIAKDIEYNWIEYRKNDTFKVE